MTRTVSPSNQIGSIFTIVPSKILFFDSPCPTLPHDRRCAELDGRVRFSAPFYAGLLSQLGVGVVLRLDGAADDPAPFAERGIRVCGPEALAGPHPARSTRPAPATPRPARLRAVRRRCGLGPRSAALRAQRLARVPGRAPTARCVRS